MELAALLCNHAEVQNNRLYILGGGIDLTVIPAGHPGPWSVSLSLALSIEVPWIETNEEHAVHIALLDAEGDPVEVPTSSTDRNPFGVDLRFNVGRPSHLEDGASQTVALAVNVPALPFEKLGSYTFAFSIDNKELRRLPYRLVGQRVAPAEPSGPPDGRRVVPVV
ncbi:hypothetical protein MRAB57_4063 [Mycobacterium rhizamassiliense]|uniref:Uncharacterized protein n=1 Tax=Mycobacterium rhizamassiliense TaxID=1841860 RepID=A0A2U3NXM8_9MYCO|nr:hypothetical protein [Mycobacterium rhizamassiliense]SPM36223.1 hypothetical protein MRAB57_4063 [Mycobacterium rhizamassiliense]